MSSAPIYSTPGTAPGERRAHSRRRLDQLAYIGFGPDSGGVLLDISEGGLRCQIIGPVIEGDLCRLKFVLPGRPLAIEADGQVVWSNTSKQGGGVRLLGLDAGLRKQLEQWIGDDYPSPASELPAPIPIRTKTKIAAPAHPAASNVSETAAPLPAQKTASSLVPSPLGTPTSPVQPEARAKAPLDILLPVQSRNRRAVAIAAVVGCMVLAIVGLAFSDFNLGRISSLLRGQVQPDLPAPLATTKPVANAEGPGPQAQAYVRRENIQSVPASDAAPDQLSPAASSHSRPQPATSSAAPARPGQPVQRPQIAEPANHPQMTMGLARPRPSSPAVPTAAAGPELSSAAIAPPPAPLMDLQSLGGRPTEMSQPLRPAIESNYQQPQLLSRVEPAYSGHARDARLQGNVQISFTIGTDGVPRSIARVSGNSALVDLAFEAVRRWRYQPATLNGQPVEAQTTASFTFQLR